MPRKVEAARDLQAQKAAYLRAQHKLSQEEIGKVLGGITQPHVSRLLARAEEMGWLVTEQHFVQRDISEEVMEEIRHLLAPQPLVRALQQLGQQHNRLIPNVRVFDSGSTAMTPEAMILRRKRFGRMAAGRLEELLRGANIIGVAWGRTVSGLIEGLASLHRGLQHQSPIQFVPVCAELVGPATPEYSSSRLTDRLHDIVNDGKGERLSLSGVPAYIPRHYSQERARVIWEYVFDIGSYQKIFRGASPLLANMDALLTSIGPAEVIIGGNATELAAAGDIDIQQLQSLVVGDMGGVLIPQLGLSDAERTLVTELNTMWTGVRLNHLEYIAHDASRNTHKKGNIVIAIGRGRATILYEIIRLGLVNELLIDHDLATALESVIAQAG